MLLNFSLPHFRNPLVWGERVASLPPAPIPIQVHPDLKNLIEQAKLPSKFKCVLGAPPRVMCGNGRVLLFEYGDAQFQYRNADILGDSTYLHPAFTVQHFSLWNKLQGKSTFPLALSMKELPKAPVAGQLFRVPAKALNDLDYHRDNGVSFVRKIIPIAIPFEQRMTVWADGKDKAKAQSFYFKDFKVTNAMVYVASSSRWKDHLSWDQGFYKAGSDFRLASRVTDKQSNKPFFKFMPDDQKKANLPLGNLDFFRTRSAYEQDMIYEYDISEQEDWANQQRKNIEERKEQAGPSSRLSKLPF